MAPPSPGAPSNWLHQAQIAGGRTDTPFWREMTATGLSDFSRNRLAHWQKNPLLAGDLPDVPAALPNVEKQLYAPAPDGLGLLPRAPAKSVETDGKQRMSARKTGEKLARKFQSATAAAIEHQRYLRQTIAT